jgi:hypothetical protein
VDEAADDVAALERQQPRHRLVRVVERVEGQALGVGLEHLADVRIEAVPVPRDLGLDPHERGVAVVEERGAAGLHEAEPAARRGEHALDHREVVLGVGPGEPERGVGVGRAVHVGHAPPVAGDRDPRGARERLRGRRRRRRRQGGSDQRLARQEADDERGARHGSPSPEHATDPLTR